MKIRKYLIITIAVIIVFTLYVNVYGFNWKYIASQAIYSNQNESGNKIVFTEKSGFFENNFYLRIYAPTKEIYYTLDGSEPTKESMKYEGPILITDASHNENTNSMRTDFSSTFLLGYSIYKTPEHLIDKCSVLKVAYYDNSGQRSKTEERVFFVNFEEKAGYDNVNIISVTAEPDDLFDDEKGIYVLGNTFEEYSKEVNLEEYKEYLWKGNYSNSGYEWEREASIHVFDKERKLCLNQAVGIRIQGGVSRSFYPKSLNLYARDEYGRNALLYDFFDTGYYPQRVTLSCGGNDYYGKMKDRLGADMTRNCNFATMHFEPYILFLNGEYWGFYYLTEKYDENYIEHYYGIDKSNVIMIKQGGLEEGTEADRKEYENMRTFIEQADMAIDENYQKACELMDMGSFIDYYAAEIYMARNADWPSANYALWRSRGISEKTYEDGKWRWMLFDVNTSAFEESLAEHDTIAYVIEECALFANLSKNKQFRIAFSDRLREMRDEVFTDERVDLKLDEYKAMMNEPMEVYFRRFFGLSNDDFHEKRRQMRHFNYSRKEYIDIMLENNGF